MTHPVNSLSVVVPVHNEEAILESQVTAMAAGLARLGRPFELLIVENGSTDRTLRLGQDLAKRVPGVRVLTLPEGDYGLALRHGILQARNDVVIVFNVEFWSLEFVDIALAALQTREMVIGSKSAPGAHDERPALRRTITRTYNLMLRWLWGFDGTDTHGMKAFHRAALAPIVEVCRSSGFVFDTELVLRAQRAGVSKIELPTDARELRAPSNRSLFRRVPDVLANLLRLWRGLRDSGKRDGLR
ncbi:MAG TPA: glycosyltransferase family 2 protein [Anaerolineales bacterium]|nr:glycosyltransferase family 2 protein [Anaerolineales bacterium]